MRVALLQQKFHLTKEATIEKSLEMIDEAKKNKAQLIVLQELHQGPYFCQSEDVSFFDLAQNYEKDIEFWKNISKEKNIVLVTSLFEKRA
jgi:N-carbamoylputrescine amidase